MRLKDCRCAGCACLTEVDTRFGYPFGWLKIEVASAVATESGVPREERRSSVACSTTCAVNVLRKTAALAEESRRQEVK